MLTILDTVPEALLDINAEKLYTLFSGPTLIRLKGKKKDPLFISSLLHGNEVSGFNVVQQLLRLYHHSDYFLPRSALLFFGNIKAARSNERFVKGQQDFNRVWNTGSSVEHNMAQEVLALAQKQSIFACIDIHNNTGLNPFYSTVNVLEPSHLHLASAFSKKIVYFVKPKEALSVAFSKFCPATTIECGLSGDEKGISKALDFVKRVLVMPSLGKSKIDTENLNIYHSVARIRLAPNTTVSFADNPKYMRSNYRFIDTIESLNFTELPENTLIGWYRDDAPMLHIRDEDDNDITQDVFTISHNEIRTRRMLVPSMFTTNVNVIYQDCLGYIMQRYSL